MEPDPARAVSARLLEALLPVALERVRRWTRELVVLRTCDADAHHDVHGAAPVSADARADGIEDMQADVSAVGWALGVLTAPMADVLGARHDPRGLEPLAELAAEAVARAGSLARREGPLPDLAPEGGWRVAWICALAIYEAGRAAGPEGLAWKFVREEADATLELRPTIWAPTSEELAAMEALLPGVRTERRDDCVRIRFPAR